MRTFLKKITSLTPIAAGAAAGMMALGVVSILGGSYDHQVVHDQLSPQKIYFPKPATYPDLKKYEGQQVLTGAQAKVYSEDQIGRDMNNIAGGKTYAQVSDEWIAGGMKNATLAGQRTTLFMGETLKGLLLNAWGWAQIGSIAVIAGILLLVLGGLLFLLPVANWWLSMRTEERRSSTQPIPRVAHSGSAG